MRKKEADKLTEKVERAMTTATFIAEMGKERRIDQEIAKLIIDLCFKVGEEIIQTFVNNINIKTK